MNLVERRAAILDAPNNPPNPFASSVWIRHFIAEVATADSQILAPQIDGDGGSLMLLLRDGRALSRFRALANYYTSLWSPLASAAADRTRAMSEMVQQLTDLRPRLDTIAFAPMDATSSDTSALANALSEHGWYVRRYFCFGNWYLPCSGLDFASYAKLKNTWASKVKKFHSIGQVQIVTEPADVDAAMAAYDAIYAKSWKHAEPYPRFVRGWARACAARGWLRMGIAWVGGFPIAAQIWFTFAARTFIFKMAYDEEHAKYSAGTVLTVELIRHALEVDRVVEIDYLTGDDPYKKSWMTHRRERIGLMACNMHSLGGLLAGGAEWAGQVRARIRDRSDAAAV